MSSEDFFQCSLFPKSSSYKCHMIFWKIAIKNWKPLVFKKYYNHWKPLSHKSKIMKLLETSLFVLQVPIIFSSRFCASYCFPDFHSIVDVILPENPKIRRCCNVRCSHFGIKTKDVLSRNIPIVHCYTNFPPHSHTGGKLCGKPHTQKILPTNGRAGIRLFPLLLSEFSFVFLSFWVCKSFWVALYIVHWRSIVSYNNEEVWFCLYCVSNGQSHGWSFVLLWDTSCIPGHK